MKEKRLNNQNNLQLQFNISTNCLVKKNNNGAKSKTTGKNKHTILNVSIN